MNYYITGKIYEKGEVTGGTSQNGNAWARMTLVLEVALGKYSKKLAFQVMTSNIDAVQAFNLGDKVEVAWDLASREYTNKDGVRSWFTQAELHAIKAAGMPENVVEMGAGVDSAMNAQPAAPAPTRELAEKMHQIICKHEAENWAKPQKSEDQAEQVLIGFDFGEGRDSAIIELWGHKYQITRID